MNYILLISVGIFLYFDQYIEKRAKYIFAGCIVISILLNLHVDANFYYLDRVELTPDMSLKLLNGYLGYSLRPFLLWGLWEILRGQKKPLTRRIFAVLALGNALIFTTCFYSDLTFGYRPGSYAFTRGPLGYTSHIVMILMMLMFVPTLINMYLNGKKSDFTIDVISLVMVLAAVYIETKTSFNCLHYVITLECLLYFSFLHLELEREYTKTLIVAQKAETMLMQIKPHFINNTLSTIQALCEIDPPLAAKTTGNFARYLRMNLTAMDKPLPVMITEEIEHTKTYLDIEMLRFPWIEAEYDIQDTGFCVPVLTIQPLVENAIQHGLRKQKHGKIWISTKKTEQGHMIQIVDNGSGFDEKNPATKEGHGIGMKNVKYRIETVSHGTMHVESNIDKGTKITIYIP